LPRFDDFGVLDTLFAFEFGFEEAQQVVGEGHQAADLPSQTDLLEENNETDKATEGGDRLGGGGEPDLPTREDSVTGIFESFGERA